MTNYYGRKACNVFKSRKSYVYSTVWSCSEDRKSKGKKCKKLYKNTGGKEWLPSQKKQKKYEDLEDFI